MDGKNVADFIDPDIAEKLEALEKEEERLEAEGFYASDDSIVSQHSLMKPFTDPFQTDSDDEREVEELRAAKMHKAASQQKKKMKNRPVMPRTAGLTTLSQMTEKLTKAGIDPSRIVERATLLAKARGAERKRKRDEDDEMEIDGGQDGQEEDWMDIDADADDSPRKRRKGVSGMAQPVVNRRAPKTDRRTTGMRDTTVRRLQTCLELNLCPLLSSKCPKPTNCETLPSGRETCWRRRASLTALFVLRW